VSEPARRVTATRRGGRRRQVEPGVYWVADFLVIRDGNQSWVVCRDTPGGTDNPLAFARTLREAIRAIRRGDFK
jgi:hypothetical protein